MQNPELSMAKKRKRGAGAANNQPADAIMHEMAVNLREHADFLDSCIAAHKQLGSPAMHILRGNFYLCLVQIRKFFRTQVLSKMASSESEAAEQQHQILSDLFRLLGDLTARMPKKGGGRSKQE